MLLALAHKDFCLVNRTVRNPLRTPLLCRLDLWSVLTISCFWSTDYRLEILFGTGTADRAPFSILAKYHVLPLLINVHFLPLLGGGGEQRKALANKSELVIQTVTSRVTRATRLKAHVMWLIQTKIHWKACCSKRSDGHCCDSGPQNETKSHFLLSQMSQEYQNRHHYGCNCLRKICLG